MFDDRRRLLERFSDAVARLDGRFEDAPGRHEDQNVDTRLRGWLDGGSEPLPWSGPGGHSR